MNSTAATVESRTITVRIARHFDQVYNFLADPANWNQWAHGLGKSIRQSNHGWIADSDGGTVEVWPASQIFSDIVQSAGSCP